MLKIFQQARVFLHLGLFIIVAAICVQAQPTRGNAPNVVPGSYIVQVEDGVDPGVAAQAMAQTLTGKVGHVYKHAIKGFSIFIPPGLTKADVERFAWVKLAEPDIMMYAFADDYPTGIKRINATPSVTGNANFSNIDVAVLDTGIDVDHPELNVVGGIHFKSNPAGRLSSDTNYDDDNGHGTHVAGTIGAKSGVATVNGIDVVGVAPGVNLWAVKVLDSRGSGYLSGIIAGIDWVTARANTIEVANMSLGGTGVSSAYRSALQKCVAAGVVMVVAAGNENRNVYGPDGVLGTSDDTVPAAYPEVMTISALADYDGLPGDGNDDTLASFSNYSQQVVSNNPVTSPGAAIDLILPGVNILSTYPGGYATASGTSMASPHAAGLVALYIAQNERATDADGVYAIRQALINTGKASTDAEGWNDGTDKDNNHENLGWAGEGSGEPEPTNTPTPEPEPTNTPTPEPEPTNTPTPEPEPDPTPEPDPAITFETSSINNGSTWTANVTVNISGDAVSVTGKWSNKIEPEPSQTSETTFSQGSIPKKQSNITFSVSIGDNFDPDNAYTVTISKP